MLHHAAAWIKLSILTDPLKSHLSFKIENYFQTCATGFVRLPYLLEKGEKVSKKVTSHTSI